MLNNITEVIILDKSSTAMHKIGENVMYGQNGICHIDDIRKEKFSNSGMRSYYVMNSIYDQHTKMYVPTDTDDSVLGIRKILSPEEINALIIKSEESTNEWIEDSRVRAETFNRLLKSDDLTDILWLLKVLKLHKIEVEKVNRKFYTSDERIFLSAEKMITEEFSFVLGIDKDEVIPYIINLIEKSENRKAE